MIDSWQTEPASLARIGELWVRAMVGGVAGILVLALVLEYLGPGWLPLFGMLWFVENGLRQALPS